MADAQTPDLPAVFRRLAWSNLAAQSAEQLGLAAAPLIAVLAFGAQEAATGALQTAQTLPFLLASLPAGLLVDRMSRARLMAGAEALRALSLLAILALMLCGALTLPLLAALGFVGACGTVAYGVAAPALVPSLVPRALLPMANGRIELARTAAFAGGPALGGALVGWVGGAPAFCVAAVLSVVAVILLAGVAEPARPRRVEPRHPVREVRDGLAFVARHGLLRPIMVTQLVFNTALFVIMAIYTPYAIHRLHLSPTGVGLTLAACGVGMVAGALTAPRIMRWIALGAVIAIGPVSGFVAASLLALTIVLPSGWLAGAGFFLMGAGPIIWVVSTTTLRQTVTPAHLLGRVSSINVLAHGARPIGAGLGAAIGGLWGPEACLVIAVAGFLGQAMIILLSPVVRLGGHTERPVDSPLHAARNASTAVQ